MHDSHLLGQPITGSTNHVDMHTNSIRTRYALIVFIIVNQQIYYINYINVNEIQNV